MPSRFCQRIALVCGAGYVSGKEVVTLELAEGLQQSGYEVEVATSRWGNGQFAEELNKRAIRSHPMWLGYISAAPRFNELRMTGDQAIHLPALYRAYRRFIRDFSPDKVIHTNWHHLLLLMPLLRPTRDLFWVHEIIPNKRQYRKLFAVFAQRLSIFVAVSEAVRRSVTNLGIRSERVVVIHNGMSPFRNDEHVEDPSKVRIGIVGQVGEWKGHEDLIEAFAHIAKQYPQTELHIFGAAEGSYADKLRLKIRGLNLDGRVQWRGFQPDRSQIYPNIDICVVPSRFEEPFGMVAVEAGMAGLPCVATRRGGLPEIIEDGVTGILVEARQPEQLSAALETLLVDPDLRRRMGVAAREKVQQKFSRERFLQQFAACLER